MPLYFNQLIGDGKYRKQDETKELGYEDVTICTWKLDTVVFDTIPDWPDRFHPAAMTGSLHDCIDGTSVMQVFLQDMTGEPITLVFDGIRAALLVDTYEDIKALCDAGEAVVFYDGTTNYDVVFDYTKKDPVSFDYLDDNQVIMKGTIYLIRV
jgi:hypothetical protein